jgi:uncharacterized iron-regulated membrane protein
MPVASFPTRDERKLAALRLAGEAQNAKGCGAMIRPIPRIVPRRQLPLGLGVPFPLKALLVSAGRLLRKIHYWTSLPLLVTVFVIAISGTLLALKKDFAALQPPTQSGSRPGDLQRPLSEIVAAALPAAKASGWEDVERIDVRPGDGIAKVVFHSRTEVQVDLASAKVLQVGYRTSDLIETIHDFSILGGWAKYLLSFGSGLAILGMAGTGTYLFVLPMLARRKKRRAAELKESIKIPS